MAEEQKVKRLGRGLSALLGDTEFEPAEDQGHDLVKLPIEYLYRNPDQPRKVFEEDELTDLANSIKEKGILQPIVVRPYGDEPHRYQIVAGERRWRAAQKAALHEVPVMIKALSDSETLEIALIENIQRTDLNPMEEAAGYKALMDGFGYTQDQLSQEIGKSRSHIANMMRLLTLPEGLQKKIEDGKLSAGHGRALLASENPTALADTIIKKNLNVRQAEHLAKHPTSAPPRTKGKAKTPATEKDADTRALEQKVSTMLGLTVSIEHRGDAGGQVVVSYKTLEQLDEICRRLSTD